jgi:3-dehydro-L-gulonate-6-phosphate decarboxylase
MSTKPRLQLALDQTRLDTALRTAETLSPHVDIIEAGTILCISAGIQAVSALRERCPQHTLVADLKVADAGATLAEQAFGQGRELDDGDLRRAVGHHGQRAGGRRASRR